ncbi:S41 family peptidase [Phenylobacterium sp.]|uniref:S41 family peptidase n=1 Tax=Phenylobacterium sp. TaxID=1871053 RepID=UPI002E3433B9|nr:PDZ domain-containing protein [Phenylobacterium sp.]HEX4709620.1 PDZ domain-containing protein [Phenylobacterium sp.]
MHLASILALAAAGVLGQASGAAAQLAPHIFQQPALSRDLIAFSYAGDIWTVPRAGGRATRVTTGVGVESSPVFSPDGQTLAFTGDYDGNTDVFTVPTAGGVPQRVTYHPAADVAVGWSSDGKQVLFRSNRAAASRYTQIFAVAPKGGLAAALPLPMAYDGKVSPDGRQIAYIPMAPAFSFDFTNYVAWGNYRGGRASTIWITTLGDLDSVEVPHDTAADFSPVWAGGKLYFLSGRAGPISIYSYDPATRAVGEVYRNSGSDIRSLASDGKSLVFDRLGELYTLEPGGQPQRVAIEAVGDMPDVRPRILNVAGEVRSIAVSPTGLRAVVEAHGEILTAPVKKGPIRNLTNSSGVMEREPAWSPDGQSIAYFSDESGLYALHVAPQAGGAVRKFPLVAEPAYFFHPVWSPDSKKIAFYDNRLHTYVLDLVTGKLTPAGEPDVWGGFTDQTHGMAWSPDSKWLAWTRYLPNHLHAVMLYSTERGGSMQVTDGMGDARSPAFDRNGKYLYFLGSNNAGMTAHGLDMTTDLYSPTRSIYALALKADTASPVAPESDDEKSVAEAREKATEDADATPAGQAGEAKAEAKAKPRTPPAPAAPKPTVIDLAGLPMPTITARTVALPIPPGPYDELSTGKPGTIFYLADPSAFDPNARGPDAILNRFTLEDRKVEKVAEHLASYQVTADGEKVLLAEVKQPSPDAPPGPPPKPHYSVVPAAPKPGGPPPKAEDTALALDGLEVRVDPPAEWAQMYREVWRIERAYFYDPNFHGFDTVAAEKGLAPYAAAVQSRSDLNYVFQEMLTGFSVGHLRGSGGAIPSAPKVSGGLLGADYQVRDGHWCLSKIYSGGAWSPDVKGPLAQPGLGVREGDCILAINGKALDAATDIQAPLEATAGKAISLKVIGPAGPHDVTVVPVASEARLRNLDWIETNRRKVEQLSGGKLAYVYLPDTGAGGFTSFNRYYFAQTDKQGAVIDERFNGGGQMADYIIEVLGRRLQSYWSPRYGAIERTPSASILGPKVMIANEMSGSGGDALPWLFKHNQLGPLVGKRTWGGLVGIGPTPVLMDGGQVTSPSVAFFSAQGQWDVENHGVEPDIVVNQDPKAVADGHDPQLEAAVAQALQRLKSAASPAPQRPAYPVYPLTPAK